MCSQQACFEKGTWMIAADQHGSVPGNSFQMMQMNLAKINPKCNSDQRPYQKVEHTKSVKCIKLSSFTFRKSTRVCMTNCRK